MNEKVCEIVVSSILRQMEQGTVPWHKPWSMNMPINAVHGNHYKGINYFVLSTIATERGYVDYRWLTMKQVNEIGGRIVKEESPTAVIFWKGRERKPVADTQHEGDELNNKTEKKTHSSYGPIATFFKVWNVEQCEGVLKSQGGKIADLEIKTRTVKPIDAAQALHDRYIANDGPSVQHGGNRACYIPSQDAIKMPYSATFGTIDDYYGVLFHEDAHSTGAAKRLARNLEGIKTFGSEDYSVEELIAELTASMLRAITGVEPNIPNSAAYIAHWSRKIKEAPTMFTYAASAAQKAVDYMLGSAEHFEAG